MGLVGGGDSDGSVGFEVERHTTLSALDTWDRLTDWERHSSLIPFTAVTRCPGPPIGVGSRFNARTSLGPVGFDDPMEVTFWRPPSGPDAGVCRLVKRGRVVFGWAVLTVIPLAEASDPGSTVSWREQADVRLVGPLLTKPTAVVGKVVFSRLVDHLLSD